MRVNLLGVSAICTMLGGLASCVAPHTIIVSTDYPQTQKGQKVQLSSSDGGTYTVTFDASKPPCSNQNPLTVRPGATTSCTVDGKGMTYTYTIVPAGQSPSTTTPRRLYIVPCKACTGLTGKAKGSTLHTHKKGALPAESAGAVGAFIVVGSVGITVVPQPCPSNQPGYACVSPGQQAEWSINGEDGTELKIDFGGNSPCSSNSVLSGGINNLPLVCTIISNASGDYSYRATLDNHAFTGTLTVKASQ